MLTTRSTLLDAQAALGSSGKVFSGEGLENLYLQLNGDNTSVLTVTFRGSLQEVAPDFTIAASPTNVYEDLAVVDLESGLVIAGGTGVALAANSVRMFTLNMQNPPTHLAAVVTSYTTGDVTCQVVATNNSIL